MSHLNTKIGVKRYLREKLGDKYLEFMTDLQNFQITHIQLSKKYNICNATITKYIEILGYSRTAKTKQSLRTYYRIASRVKERQEKTRKLIQFLQKIND